MKVAGVVWRTFQSGLKNQKGRTFRNGQLGFLTRITWTTVHLSEFEIHLCKTGKARGKKWGEGLVTAKNWGREGK